MKRLREQRELQAAKKRLRDLLDGLQGSAQNSDKLLFAYFGGMTLRFRYFPADSHDSGRWIMYVYEGEGRKRVLIVHDAGKPDMTLQWVTDHRLSGELINLLRTYSRPSRAARLKITSTRLNKIIEALTAP